MKEKYGNIYSLRFGHMWFVIVSGLQQVKDALVYQGEDFVDRPTFPLIYEISGTNGE